MRARYLRFAVMAGLFVGSFQLSSVALPRLPLRAEPYPRQLEMPAFEVPETESGTRDDYFFVYSTDYELSQLVLYHGLGASIDNARRADILFIGNSRLPMGLREEVIAPAAEALGLRSRKGSCQGATTPPAAPGCGRRRASRPAG